MIAEQLADLQSVLKKVQKEFERRKLLWDEKRWNDKAQAITQRLVHAGRTRAERLRSKSLALENTLTDWLEQLRDRQKDVSIFLEKQDHYGKPLLVSRARKRPEQHFIERQNVIEREALEFIEKLNGSLDRCLQRIERAQDVLGHHGQPVHAELQHLQNELRPLQEKILSETQRFEGGRDQLEALRKEIDRMTCVEDLPAAKRGIFRGGFLKILRRMLPHRALPQ